MKGIRVISGSLPIRFKKRVMVASESIIPSSMLMSRMLAPFFTCWRATATAPSKSPPRISFEKRGEPVMFVRSPTITKPVSGVRFRGSSPESCMVGDTVSSTIFRCRGGQLRTASAICRMCAGVVPQHPPTTFSQPLRAQSRSCGARLSGVSGNPVSESGSGSPAFG